MVGSTFPSASQTQSGFGGTSTSSNIFAQAQTQPNIFGATPQTQANIFGATPQTQANIFGATPQSQPNIFASSQPQTQTPLFGSTSQPQSSGFGTSTTTPASQSLLFGAASQPALFGASSTATQPSLFGAPAAAPQQSLFGSSTTPSKPTLFGQPQSQSNIFGASAAASQPSLFGGAQPTTTLFGTSAQPSDIAQFGQPQHAQQLPESITDIIEKLNPSHPDSAFRATLYKVETPELVPLHQRPATMTEREYETAQASNPDPSRLVPVQAKLFDDLLGRAEAQETRVNQNNAILLNIQRTITEIHNSIDTDLQPRLAAYRRRHRELARRVLRIASSVELSASRSDASGALSTAEVDHKRRLDALSQALTAPGVFKHKLYDLLELSQNSALDNKTAFAADLRDPRAAAVVFTLLTEQLRGIEHLNDVCAKVRRDTDIIVEGISKNTN